MVENMFLESKDHRLYTTFTICTIRTDRQTVYTLSCLRPSNEMQFTDRKWAFMDCMLFLTPYGP